MEWFFIEALFALAVAIAIVWWTMAPGRKRPRVADPKSDPKPADPADAQAGAGSGTRNQ